MTSIDAGSSHTNWSLIFDAARGDQAAATAALERLVRRYWPAVYAFIRQSGHDLDEASDLTQAFVCDVVLLRNLFQRADPKRGRFRTLLLTSLQNYLRQQHRDQNRQKRSPPRTLLRIDESELSGAKIASNLTPEQAFSMQWHATMIRRALERVRSSCMAAGLEAHWRVFEARVVKPMLFGDKPTPYPKLVELLELDDSGQAANMMVAVRRKFVLALVEEIGCTVSDPLHIEEELRELLREVEAPQ